MTITNQSWLYKNDTRQYPLVDEAVGATNGLVDASISIPDTLVPPGARLFVGAILVSSGVASVEIFAEGVGLVASVAVRDPQAYRLYPLAGAAPGVYGFVIFGSACDPDKEPVSAAPGVTTGTLLESVITRYPQPAVPLEFIVGGAVVSGAVAFKGVSGVVTEIVPVYFDSDKETRPALVIRCAHNNNAMFGPVAACDLPAEVSGRTDLASTINGVPPDLNGHVYLQLQSTYDFVYDAPDPLVNAQGQPIYDSKGNPVYDPQASYIWKDKNNTLHYDPPSTPVSLDANGAPITNPKRPLLTLAQGFPFEIVFQDFLDYRELCSGKRLLSKVAALPPANTCANCTTATGAEGGGIDNSDGVPIAMVGASIWQDQLCLYWAFSPLGGIVQGNNPVDIQINMQPPLAVDPATKLPLPPLKVTAVTRISGVQPRYPGDLKPGQGQSLIPGTLGSPVHSVYTLNRPAVAGEAFTITLPHASVLRSTPPGFPVNYPVYHSSPKTDSCVRYCRSPTSTATSEFLK